jgi:L-methionine (R)-S-oxide reductase
MAESLQLTDTTDREVIYNELVPQIDSLISVETDLIANLANVAAVLKEAFGFLWVGFYLKKGDQLVLGPFQGPLACTRIRLDQGVCGHAYTLRETTIVPDVDQFPGHIVCSSAARSEIVVPIFGSDKQVLGVLDIDSDKPNDLTTVDADGLGCIVKIIEASVARTQGAAAL